MPDIDMDIILTGDALPEKINNIKQGGRFKEEMEKFSYYSHEYSILYTQKLDTLRISTKNITDDKIDDFKTYLKNSCIIVYKTSYLSSLSRFLLYITASGGFDKSTLMQLVLNENIRYIEPLGYTINN